MIADWNYTTLGNEIELLYGKSLPRKERINGDYPVYGSNGVIDFHNESLVSGPGIIIGRKGSCGEVHYSSFGFWPIDTTYYVDLLKENNLRFLAYLLSSIGLNQMNSHSTIPGLNRKNVYEIQCQLPTLPEQKKIAAVLFKIQKAIEVQDKIIEATKELKKATMQRLFTKGLRGEKTKHTEIGEIPESWVTKSFYKVAEFKNGINFSKEQKGISGIPTIDVLNMYTAGSEISVNNVYRVNKNIDSSYFLEPGDILFVRSSLKYEGIGWTSMFSSANEPVTYCGFIIRARLFDKENLNPRFLVYYFRTDHARNQLISKGDKVAITNINQGNLKNAIIPIPKPKEQREIANILGSIDRKLFLYENKKIILQGLFKTMLNKLMSGEIRVNDLKIDITEVSTNG